MRDLVQLLHVVVGIMMAVWTEARWELGWISLVVGLAVAVGLELSLRTRPTAWIAYVVGTAFSALFGLIAGGLVAVWIHRSRAAALAGAIPGALAGGALAVALYRKIRSAS
jgi:hypothetical protein